MKRGGQTGVLVAAIATLAMAPAAGAASFPAAPGSLGPIPDAAGSLSDCHTPLAFNGTRDVTFQVSGLPTGRPLGDVAISGLEATHSWVGDLDVTLIAPAGEAEHVVFSRTGATAAALGGDDSNLIGAYRFSDRAGAPPSGGWWQASSAATDLQPVPTGHYRATEPGGPAQTHPAPPSAITPSFAGISNPNGTWTLRFRDGCTEETGSVSAATLELKPEIVVTTLADLGPGSLRAAITEANATAGFDMITFASGLSGTIQLQSELPQIAGEVEIQGPGPETIAVRRDGALEFRIFSILSGGHVAISGLTLSNGHESAGGGIANAGGTVTIEDLVVTGNTASVAGGLLNFGGGTLTVRRSAVTGNTSAVHTGGIGNFEAGSTLTVEKSTISGNTAGAQAGGGLANADGTLLVRNSTVAANQALGASASGGGVVSAGGSASVESTTLSGNQASAAGANVAGNVTLRGTILSDPQVGTNCSGPVVSNGFNLASDGSCGLTMPNDQPSTDPELGPLADNGGPTRTMAPAHTSPAIDRGYTAAFAGDQRGEARRVDLPGVANAPGSGDGGDVGAVELQPSEIPALGLSITGGPSGLTSQSQPTFGFAVENEREIECSIDDGEPAFGPCAAATTHWPADPVVEGDWTFRVRARNGIGEMTDTRSFTVDTIAPAVEVTGGPADGSTVATNTTSFAFSADEPGPSFECRLDGGAFAPCSSPRTYFGLVAGPHGFRVRATDEAGNIGPGRGRTFTILTAAATPPAGDECARAEAALAEAERAHRMAKAALKKARAALRKVKAAGDAGKVRKAKAKVKKAKRRLAAAKERRSGAAALVDQACG